MMKKPTSNDIAKLANVSQTAVSLVLRDKWQGRVSPKVAERILRIADENNYRVNHIARMLRSGSSRNIALVVPDIENPFYSQILHNLNKVTEENNYVCLLIETKTNGKWYSFLETALLSELIEIAIICYEDLPKRNPAIDKRIILLNEYLLDIHSISIDFYNAIKDGVRHLSKKQYQKIFHVRTNLDKPTFTLRQKAFQQECESLQIPHETIIVDSYSNSNLAEILESKANSFSYPVAFLCDDDMLTSGIYVFAQKHDVKIGHQIGVIGMDNIYLCNYFYPRLSSYGYDINLLTDGISRMISAIHTQDLDVINVNITMELESFDSF